jgi:hypothetical protein
MILLLLLAAWEPVSDKDGIRLERRVMLGRPYKELRLSTRSAVPIEKFDAFFRGPYLSMPDKRVERQLVEKSPDRMSYYDRIRTPLGSDRDYFVEMRRAFDKDTGVLEWRFAAIDHDKYPVCAGCVRMPLLYGQWVFSPAEGGGTDVSYVIYSDPGGDFPKWIVASEQRKTAIERIKMVVQGASK